MTLEEEYAILSYLPLSRRANIGANIIANISARKKMEDRGERRKTETQRIFTLVSGNFVTFHQSRKLWFIKGAFETFKCEMFQYNSPIDKL